MTSTLNSSTLRFALLGLTVGLLASIAPGCTSTTGGTGGGAGGGTAAGGGVGGGTGGGMMTDAGEDAGVDAGPPPCLKDDDCAARKDGSRCDQTSGQCIKAKGCTFQSDCQSEDPTDYCYRYGAQCRCAEDTGAPSGSNGVCRRRHGICEECTTDAECGSDLVFDPQGVCKQLMGDSSGKKYCFQQKQGSCPCGMVDDGFGFCRPQSNSCSAVGCAGDKDCASGSVCSSATCGTCEPRCRWDFIKKDVAAPGCQPGKVCWVDSANLDPKSLYYGSGRCRAPCKDDAECKKVLPDGGVNTANPFGGPNLTCRTESLLGGGKSEKRCRADGECMDLEECPVQPPSSNYYGYCDRASFACKTDCRTGNDPVTGMAFKDCRMPYACAANTSGADAGANFCKLQTCLEQGGALIACARGQYCCGEDKNGDGMADPCPPKNDRGADECYDAPAPPFCTQACKSHEECEALPAAAWLTGANQCANGSKYPNCSLLPARCAILAQNMQGKLITACLPPSVNDITRDAKGIPKDSKACPSGWSPRVEKLDFTAMDQASNCTTDADCQQGGADAGRCGVDMGFRLMDGGFGRSCMCTAGGTARECPNDKDAGFVSECRAGISGQTTTCISTVSCSVPSVDSLFEMKGAPNYGCGLMPMFIDPP